MIFSRVYLNANDGKFYVEDIGTVFDNFWTSLLSKGAIGTLFYKLVFDIIVGISKVSNSYKTARIDFD